MEPQVTYRSELELLTCATPSGELKYRVFQIYGQKYVKLLDPTEDPEPFTEVYASNIPRAIAVDALFKFFARCGRLHQLRLLMDFSGSNRGTCFVQYARVRESREAVCCLHGEDVGEGHRVVVKVSLNNNRLVLKAVPGWAAERAVRDVVVAAMGEGLTGVAMWTAKTSGERYCFCTYRDHKFAVMAHKKAWPQVRGAGMVMDVHWAVPKLVKNSTNLYFTNLPLSVTKKEFFEMLAELIELKTLVQFRISTCHGYIRFTNRHAMVKAEKELKGLTIKGSKMKFSRTPLRKSNREIDHSCDTPATPKYNTVTHPVLYRNVAPAAPSVPCFGYYPVPRPAPRMTTNVPILMRRVPAISVPVYNSMRMMVRSGRMYAVN